MIKLYCGDIRAGKTSLMTYQGILNALNAEKRAKMRAACKSLSARGFAVCADKYALYADYNIVYDNMHGDVLRAQKINPLEIGRSVFIRPHSTLLISEFQGYFNARRSMSLEPKTALFFQTSGHFGVDLYLDCQDIDNVDKVIRNISHITKVHNRTVYDARGKVTDYADARNFSRIIWNITEYENAAEFDGGKGHNKTITADFNIFDCYNSFERFDNFLPTNKDDILI